MFDTETGGAHGTLDLRLLGHGRAQVDGRPLEVLRSARAMSLLAYLVLHADAPQPRQDLAFTLWPDSPEGQARTNLRNRLHILRRAHPSLDAEIEVTATTLQWRRSGRVDVDVERFVDAADRAVATDPDDVDELVRCCREATAEYGGRLLAGIEEEWLQPARQALNGRYCDMLRRLATALVDAGRPTDALEPARQLVQADPLDETWYRLLMEAYERAGHWTAAVRTYHECTTVLDRDLGVRPSDATRIQYASLLDEPRSREAKPTLATARSGLVGRDAELRRLLSAWDAATRGTATAVLVTGEPGIGKTRLVEELSSACRASGASIGSARSFVTEGELGFAVVSAWLRSPDLVAARPNVGSAVLSELARALPELGPIGSETPVEADGRRRFFDAAVSALTATGRPTLLIADDAQWSDKASQELTHYLLRRQVDARLLVVLTARTEDLGDEHSVVAIRDSLALLGCLREIRLGRLAPDATAALGAQLLGAPLGRGAAEDLFTESEGNPLFVVETVRSGWDGHGSVGLSPRLRAVIDGRLRPLTDAARAVVDVAAVAGRPCRPQLLGLVSTLEDRPLALAIDELWRRGIVVETESDMYDFSHAKLREAAYDQLSPATRRTHHAAVANALALRADHDGDVAASEVAAHFEAANLTEDAVTWLHRAALEAHQRWAYQDALRLIERALDLVPALPTGVRHAAELELLSTLPLALAGVDGYGTARMNDAHRRAERVATSLGVELEPAFVRTMVMSALCRDEFAAAAAAARQLHERALELGDESLRIESHYLLGISAFWAADLDAARTHFESVVGDFDPSTRAAHHTIYGHDPQVVCLSRLANTYAFIGHVDDAREACERALALADDVDHPLSHDTAAIFACLLAVDLGDHRRLRERVSRLGRLDSLPHLVKRDALLGFLDVLDGQPEGVTRISDALLRCGDRNFYPGFRATIARVLVAAHEVVGPAPAALDASAEAIAVGGTQLWIPEILRVRAAFLDAAGADARAVTRVLTRAAALAREQGAGGHLHRIEASRKRLAKRS